MSRTDLISDAFTMVRNAIMVRKETVDVPASGTLKSIFNILKNEHYVDNFKEIEDKKQGIIRVYLKYGKRRPAISNIQRISRPSLRVYVKRYEIPNVLRGKGIAIISTSKGIMTNKDAKAQNLGGEVIAYIW